ncbi:hypothetical protein [Algiphilus sp.]|uniref:hypothetical protein n=1 Tax=Algiphilus sp. TaxID=1872431 RepID=UPI0032F0604F
MHLIFRAYLDTGLGKSVLYFAWQRGVRATVTSIFSGALAQLDATPAKQGRAISTIYALRHNFLAVTCYGKSMSELVRDAASSEDAMFYAISIDPAAVNCRPCRWRLQSALVRMDRDFKNKLANKLQHGKQPHTPQYPELELCLYVLRRGRMLGYFKGENGWRLFGEELADLKLYSASSDKRSLIRLIDRRIEVATRKRGKMS